MPVYVCLTYITEERVMGRAPLCSGYDKLPAEIARRGVAVMAVRGRRSGAEGRIKARGRQAKACAERSAEVRVRHADRDRREKGLEEATGARATRGTKIDAGGLG